MTRFTARDTSNGVVAAPRERVWAVLTDPVLLPRLTPYLRSIEVDGDRWRWHMAQIPLLGLSVAPSFTERMMFDEPSRITFTHEPTAPDEKAGVEGSYSLTEVGGGTHLAIDIEICVDLPLPGLARRGVQAGMYGVIAVMGKRFGANLVRELGSRSGS